MRLPWPWRRKPAPRHGEVPVAVGTHLHVAASDDEEDDGAESTASSEQSHLTLPVEEPVHVVDDEADPWDGVHAHYEVAGSGSSEEPQSGSESSYGEPGEAGHHRSRSAGRHHSPRGRRRRRSARVPAFMVAGTAAAVMLLVLAALVAWKRRQRAAS